MDARARSDERAVGRRPKYQGTRHRSQDPEPTCGCRRLFGFTRPPRCSGRCSRGSWAGLRPRTGPALFSPCAGSARDSDFPAHNSLFVRCRFGDSPRPRRRGRNPVQSPSSIREICVICGCGSGESGIGNGDNGAGPVPYRWSWLGVLGGLPAPFPLRVSVTLWFIIRASGFGPDPRFWHLEFGIVLVPSLVRAQYNGNRL